MFYSLNAKYLFVVLMIVASTICRSEDVMPTRLVAHRVLGDEQKKENNLEDFKKALLSKVDAVEIDVHLTLDKVLVVYHDPFIFKSGKKEELAKKEFAFLQLPRIEDFLKDFAKDQQKKLLIDLKGDSPDLVKILLTKIKDFKIDPLQVILISFNEKYIREIKRIDESMQTIYLTATTSVGEGGATILSSEIEKNSRQKSFIGSIDDFFSHVESFPLSEKPTGIGFEANSSLLTEEWVKKSQAKGFITQIWFTGRSTLNLEKKYLICGSNYLNIDNFNRAEQLKGLPS